VPGTRAPRRPTPPLAVLLARVAMWAALGVGVGLTAAVFAPAALGFKSFTVLSGSMAPALEVGDVIVDQPVSARNLLPGDVITYPDPETPGRLITHRAQSIRIDGGVADIVTKGDANSSVEHWRIPADDEVGRVVYRLPYLGYAMVWSRTPLGRMLLLVVPALGLGLLGLRRIWRPARPAATA
jgi:signal peptidase